MFYCNIRVQIFVARGFCCACWSEIVHTWKSDSLSLRGWFTARWFFNQVCTLRGKIDLQFYFKKWPNLLDLTTYWLKLKPCGWIDEYSENALHAAFELLKSAITFPGRWNVWKGLFSPYNSVSSKPWTDLLTWTSFVHFQEIQLGSANPAISHLQFLFTCSKPQCFSDPDFTVKEVMLKYIPPFLFAKSLKIKVQS